MLDHYQGCLVGGAVGDALGYPVEFYEDCSIFKKYGEHGITEFDLVDGVAQISDDTQMTLFTAEGLLRSNGNPIYSVARSYRAWLKTQQGDYPAAAEDSVLLNKPTLYSRRAPGMTCISAISQGCNGTIHDPINNSKGCGGIMRVAPIALVDHYSIEEAAMLGAQAAALTHGHELGYIPAAMLVYIIRSIIADKEKPLSAVLTEALNAIPAIFLGMKHTDELLVLTRKAMQLADADFDDLNAIRQLGEGWVAEETLAIAVYCSLKYSNDFEKGIIAAVNHSGDSDSTGAVTGNILGAYLGMSSIPEKYLQKLELKEELLRIARELYDQNKINKN